MIRAFTILVPGFMFLATCAQENRDVVSRSGWTVTRSDANPLLTTESEGMMAEHGYVNVNGPSVIRVPDWVESPLGRYYLYFAHHRGSFIRMAYSDDLEGPWLVKDSGALYLDETPALDHVASPDVLVDDEARTILMFFHSVDDTVTWKQTTYLATSPDGLQFDAGPEPIGPPYLRVFRWEDEWWGLAKVRGGPGGVLLRASAPGGPAGPVASFDEGPIFLEGMRHAAVLVQDDVVEIFFSRIGDEPERLLVASFDPSRMWRDPYIVEIRELLRPDHGYEGADRPIHQSAIGETTEPVNALRDPYVFVEEGGETYLFYSIAGENGIAVGRISR